MKRQLEATLLLWREGARRREGEQEAACILSTWVRLGEVKGWPSSSGFRTQAAPLEWHRVSKGLSSSAMARPLGEAPGCMFFPWCPSGPGSGPTYSGDKVFASDEKVTEHLLRKAWGVGGGALAQDFLKNPHYPNPINKVQGLR